MMNLLSSSPNNPPSPLAIQPAVGVPKAVLEKAVSETLGNRLLNLGSPYEDHHRVSIDAYWILVATMPRSLLERVIALRSDPTSPSALLIKNLPVDPALPETPANRQLPQKGTFFSEGILLGTAFLLGSPFSYTREKKGALIHNIRPLPGREAAQANDGSKTHFGFHTECAYFSYRPDFLMLYCLRPDRHRQAATLAADLRAALKGLDARDQASLRKPLFRIRAPQSFDDGLGGVRWSRPRPLVTGPREVPELCVNMAGTEGLTPRAEGALRRLDRALNSPEVVQAVHLEAGDLLIVDNRKAVHGRNSFVPSFDGYDRWLQRVYVKNDLWNGRGTPGLVF